jgi:putative spermidine/putrescine transport system substrate-binding protein
MTKRRVLALMMLVALVAAACGDDDATTGGPLTEVGDGEGAVSIIAWAGYIEDGSSDEGVHDWVTGFESSTGCEVTVKTAATSDEMVALMQGSNEYDLVTDREMPRSGS